MDIFDRSDDAQAANQSSDPNHQAAELKTMVMCHKSFFDPLTSA